MFEEGKEFVGDYFTKDLIRRREVEAEVDQEPQDKEELEVGFADLMRRVQEQEDRFKTVISDEKVVNFETSAALAAKVAREEEYDIFISRGETVGKVIIETDRFAFEDFMNKDNKEKLMYIIMKADSIWCEAEIKEIDGQDANVIKLSLMFGLCDKIEK